MIELKVATAYIRRYRDNLGKRTTVLGTVKTVASSRGRAHHFPDGLAVRENLFDLAQQEANFTTTYDEVE